ncbi:hypothetical protein PS627_04516 [Pseudomonas fluorescens]|nr:hypothetical protein PS627_04516 [Pseudomonas fluorescens]VVQ06438.1 hypothetical protein PS910_04365 [Pseudomonas fluorescens]
MVMAWPFANVTKTGTPVTGAPTEAVYTMVPPSVTLGVAVRVTVEVSVTSVTAVLTSAGLEVRFS